MSHTDIFPRIKYISIFTLMFGCKHKRNPHPDNKKNAIQMLHAHIYYMLGIKEWKYGIFYYILASSSHRYVL